MNQKYNEVKEAIIKAQPTRIWYKPECKRKCCNDGLPKFVVEEQITLADALVAIGERNKKILECTHLENGSLISKELDQVLLLWEFKHNTLDQQSEETIDFLHSILCPSTIKRDK